MDRILRKEMGLHKAAKIGIAVGLTAFVLVGVLLCGHLFFGIRSVVREQAIRSITNISQLNEDSVSLCITNRQTLLEMLASRLEKRGVKDVDVVLHELTDFQTYYNFVNMGVLTPDMKLTMMNGIVIDAAGTDFAQQVWDEQSHMTESYPPYDGSEYMVNAFSSPVFENGEVAYVLVATYQSINLTQRMNISSMEGMGYTFLINRQGKVVILAREYEDAEYIALMNHIDASPDIIPSPGSDSYFTYDGESYYAHFEELATNGWFLMTCAKESDVFAEAHRILRITFIGIGTMLAMVFIAILSIVLSICYSRRALRQSFFYDDFLKIRNGNALSAYFRNLPPDVLTSMYMVVFDIDRFKEFNYIYGDNNGDNLLRYLVRAFEEEAPEVYLFRYVTDHFVTLDKCPSRAAFEQKIQKVLDRFSRDIAAGVIQPFDISAGVRRINPNETMRRVLSDALIARETVKGNHLKHYAFYDEEIRRKRVGYREMELAFPTALRDKEFHVYYQPKFDMVTGEVIGAEALSRWIKKDGRIISPGKFIPCFESSRQICQLDEEMLTEVCRQMKEMLSDGLDVKKVSINLSRVHLRHPDIFTRIAKIIQDSGVNPALLSFEITESALYEDNSRTGRMIEYLHGLGCSVEMDDYGVGVSGPKALASNRFDVVKMDKSFVDSIGDEHVADIIQSTISLAKKWGMEILAEGVEAKEQADQLVAWGCTLAQGFYYARPMPEQEYRALLKKS